MSGSGKMSNETQRRAMVGAIVANRSRRRVVERGFVERAGECPPLRLAHRRPVQPVHVQHRAGYGRDWPLAGRAVAQREHGTGIAGVIRRDDVVARLRHSRPAVEIAAAEGKTRLRLRPPRRAARHDGIERQRVLGDARSALRHVELDGELTVHHGQREAARIEAHARDGRDCATPYLVLRSRARAQRVYQRRERSIARVHQALDDGIRKDVRQLRRGARAQVEHAAPRRVPGLASRLLDVDMILEREKRPVNAEQLQLGGCLRGGILGALFLGLERTLAGMAAAILSRDARNDAVLEDDAGVAVQQITPVDALSDEQRVVVRAVVVREVYLVVAPAVESERERSAARAHAGWSASHPEGGILRGGQELRGRRRACFRRPAGRLTAAGEHERKEQDARADGTNHRGKYTAYGRAP